MRPRFADAIERQRQRETEEDGGNERPERKDRRDYDDSAHDLPRILCGSAHQGETETHRRHGKVVEHCRGGAELPIGVPETWREPGQQDIHEPDRDEHDADGT